MLLVLHCWLGTNLIVKTLSKDCNMDGVSDKADTYLFFYLFFIFYLYLDLKLLERKNIIIKVLVLSGMIMISYWFSLGLKFPKLLQFMQSFANVVTYPPLRPCSCLPWLALHLCSTPDSSVITQSVGARQPQQRGENFDTVWWGRIDNTEKMKMKISLIKINICRMS